MNTWTSDPPGTINPAKLHGTSPAAEPVRAASPALCTDLQTAPKIPILPTAPSFRKTRPAVPLPRISSDLAPAQELLDRWHPKYEDVRKEFERSHTILQPRLASSRARRTSHHGYFRNQISSQSRPRVPVDLSAPPDATVVIDPPTESIYDVYLLRSDIKLNINTFRRHQILLNPESGKYTLVIREGRIGQEGTCKDGAESTDLKSLALRFRRLFRVHAGVAWNRRYEPSCQRDWCSQFVELDYRLATAPPKELPNYDRVDSMIDGEVKEMMELMLYGGLVRNPNASENPKKATSWSSFSAPYEQLSHWTIFVAFKSLECISKQLGSQHPIRWKAIIAASSRYRSRIPFCAEGNRVPVISSYHAVFIELKFLYSLWPQQDIASLASKIHSRASLQINEYKSLTQPLYHAYSSLRHGFRRLTDTSTTEHKELENYLLRSRHSAHYIKFEVKEIYKVFVKAGVPNSYNNWIDNTLGHEFCAEHRLLLWHGTPLSSLLGILDLGLQIRRPGANWTGTMFGNGIYLADVSSKSAGYCQQRLGEGEAVLLLCEADVGAHRIKSRNSIHNANDIVEISAGIHRCIEGTGRIQPAKWKPVEWEAGGLPSTAGGRVLMPDVSLPYKEMGTGGSLMFNEYVIYDPSHVIIRYLFRLKIKRR